MLSSTSVGESSLVKTGGGLQYLSAQPQYVVWLKSVTAKVVVLDDGAERWPKELGNNA